MELSVSHRGSIGEDRARRAREGARGVRVSEPWSIVAVRPRLASRGVPEPARASVQRELGPDRERSRPQRERVVLSGTGESARV